MWPSNNLFLALVFMSLVYKVSLTEDCGSSWLRYINPFYKPTPCVHNVLNTNVISQEDCGYSWFRYINPFYKPTPCVHKSVNVTATATNRTKNVDKVFDYVLCKVRELLVNANQKTIVIPDISESFLKLGVRGNFNSWNGSFEDLSTIYRTGDIETQTRPTSLRIKFSVGLKDALLKYENYRIKFLNVGPDGRLMMKICDNSLNVDVTVSYNPKIGISRSCKVKLNHIHLDKFGDIQVDMTGLGPFNWALNMVSRWTLGTLHSDIKHDFEKVIKVNLQSVLNYGDLCRYLRTA